MKYIIVAVLSLFLSGCYEQKDTKNGLTTIQAEASKQAIVSDPLIKDRDIGNNINEALAGCQLAQEIEDYSTKEYLAIGTNANMSNKYNCAGVNNPISNAAGETIGTIMTRLDWFISIGAGIFVLLILGQKLLALMGFNLSRVNNSPITVMKSIFEYMIVIFIFPAALIILKISIGWANVVIKLDNDAAQLKEVAQVIPNFSSKNERLSNILDYLICIKSNGVKYSDQSPDISISKAPQGRTLSASYGQCKLVGGYNLDNKGIEVSKKYGLPDYTRFQDDAVEAALGRFIQAADQIAAKYSVGLSPVIMKGVFKQEEASCSIPSLVGIDTTYFPPRDLEKYKAFALNCMSRKFVFDLVKTNTITMDSIDKQEVTQGHRRNFICGGGFEPKAVISLENTQKLYQQCVSENCSSSASPYACGTALNGYSLAMNDTVKSFYTLPANDVRRKTFDNASAETVINSFNADFSFMEEREFYPYVGTQIAKFPASSTAGTNTVKQLMESFRIGLMMKEEGMGGFNLDTLIGRFTGRDGIAGSTKFITCMRYPNVMHNGFDCGNIYQEMNQFGVKLTIISTQLKLANAINKSPNFKKKMNGSDMEYSAMKKILTGFVNAGTAKKLIAWTLPIATDAVGASAAFLANDNIFAEDFHSVTNNYTEYYTFMFISQLSDSAAEFIMTLANAAGALGQLFIFLLPSFDYLIFFAILAGKLFEMVFNSATYKIRWLINLDAQPERRDLDRIAIVIYAEKLIFAALNATIGFLLIPHVFATTFVVVVGDLNEFSTSLFGWGDSIRATACGIIMSLLVIIIIYKITSKLMEITSGISEGFMHGKVTQQDMRVQGSQESKAVLKSFKGSIAS